MARATLKGSPRCKQIEILPSITMARTFGPKSPNSKLSPILWDEKLHLWTRNKTLMASVKRSLKPSIQNSKVDHVLEEQGLRPLADHADEPTRLGNTHNAKSPINNMHFVTMSTLLESFCHVNIANAVLVRALLSPMEHVTNCQDFQERLNSSPCGRLHLTGHETTDPYDTEGFDGIGLRPRSESNTGWSRQPWVGDQDDSSRNLRQRTEDHGAQNRIANDNLDNYERFQPGENLPTWFPQPGDIIVHSSSRPGDHLSPGGHVTLYKDEEFFAFTGNARIWRQFQYPLEDGDFVVRLGRFAKDWRFRSSSIIQTFLFDEANPPYFWLVARNYSDKLQPPEYQYDPLRAPLNTVDRFFRPRQGDLVVSVVRGEHRWGQSWWHYSFDFNPGDLVLRVGYEVKANGTCMVVELFLRGQNDRDWTFRGRDVWTYLNRDFDPERDLNQDMEIE